MSKIMVVEDDASLREIYGIRIAAEGYEVVSAGDGEEALAMAVREKPDLILSDVMMPKISGFDMLDILRATPETTSIKVIMMTALSGEDQRQRGERLGADRYLVKSQVGIEDVVNVIHEVLGDRSDVISSSAAPTEPVTDPAANPAADPAMASAAPAPSSVPIPDSPVSDPAAPAPSAPAYDYNAGPGPSASPDAAPNPNLPPDPTAAPDPSLSSDPNVTIPDPNAANASPSTANAGPGVAATVPNVPSIDAISPTTPPMPEISNPTPPAV